MTLETKDRLAFGFVTAGWIIIGFGLGLGMCGLYWLGISAICVGCLANWAGWELHAAVEAEDDDWGNL